MSLNDKELNDLSLKRARKEDYRTYFQYYCSLLRIKHMIIKIMNVNDYNSRIIKIYLCIYNFTLCYSVNALFFNDDTMHKIYLDGGDFNFIYQLPQIIYSTAISLVFQQIINFLALSENSILKIKNERNIKNIMRTAQEVLKTLFTQFISFFVFCFISVLIFWYYVSCFCAVYKNTQIHLIKDTLISFGTSMISPLFLSLVPGCFRIPAIKKNKSLMYKFSKGLQFLM